MKTIQNFIQIPFIEAVEEFYKGLNIPVNVLSTLPTTSDAILGNDNFKDLIEDVYPYGIINDAVFDKENTFSNIDEVKTLKSDYEGILLFGITLKSREHDLLPTRSQLADITRAVNKAFPFTPVNIIFKYGKFIALANTERMQYKQTWREGEKLGKVSLLRDIDCKNIHSGHLRILELLSIDKIREYDRKNKVTTFNELYKGWQNIFNTSILNEQFYKDYQQLSIKLIKYIYPIQEKDKLKAHQGALNLLNRMMFVYFIQKKKWLMNDKEFLFHFWQEYQLSNTTKNTFHEFWLNKVFFKAFNGKAFNDPEIFKTLPEKYHSEILNFPYLNGGLFTKTECDNFILTDELFGSIFEFLQGYIFTISEDTVEEINLEISPELLGKMYEGMINATDLDDVDAENGIVYTERPEINFMTRRSFVEVLHKKLPNTFSREFLYHFCFDKPTEKLELVKKYKVDVNLLKDTILSITSLDPTCGSGSMLIGVIQLQVELIRTLDESIGNKHTPHDDFQLKKQIISECIYGVDIKEWAVRIAELRFWLYMIAEAEFTTEQLTKEPLLPNLDFKLRQGNSLLQEIGSKNFSLKSLFKGRKRNIGATKKLNDFIKKKKLFIINQSESGTSYKQLKEEELRVFRDFINELKIENIQQITTIRKGDGQFALFDSSNKENKTIFESLIFEIEKENEQLDHFLNVIKTTGRIPFSYDIDFMEIFVTNEDAGFDLIIGNPPYVRQEDILPADNALELERLLREENKAEKAKVSKEYKEKLSAKVYEALPFLSTKAKTVIGGKNKTINIYGDKVPGRSDLYVYFQLLMPTLLNSKGTFCFIISNSWLDVEYGSFVQHFLLKHTQLYAIYDCNVRSFAAKVNTIIYFHSAITNANLTENQYKTFVPSGDSIKFIMNKADYTETAYAPLLIEQEHCRENTFMTHYRLITKKSDELYLEAFDENEKSFIGDKWGGKWLNSPEIYFKIQKNENVVRLKTILSYSQRNNLEVFERFKETNDIDLKNISYLNTSKIASKIYLKPTEIKNKIDYKTIIYKDNKNKYLIPDLISNRFIGNRIFFIEGDNYVVGDTFFIGGFKDKSVKEIYLASLNSTISFLNVLVTGRKNMGDGVLLFYGPEFNNLELVIPKRNIDKIKKVYSKIKSREVCEILVELGFDKNQPIRNQVPNPLLDRKELDDLIFDELDLSIEERKEVYWATAELVKERLDKAASR
jgi:hypothetical protein